MDIRFLGSRFRRRSRSRSQFVRGFAQVEALEPRALLASNPTATLAVPPDPFIGSTLNFTVTFSNPSGAGVTPGYSPFLDVVLPTTGAQGNDGISFDHATYLGSPLSPIVQVFPASGKLNHPFAKNPDGSPVVVTGTPGDQLVVLSLPFGSFVPDQPPAPVAVTANVSNLANVGTALPIEAQAGFTLGDQPIVTPGSGSVLGPTVQTDTTPSLLHLTKTYLGPENETATGPNFPEQYRIDVAVAPGQTVQNLDITDQLPPSLQFLNVVSTSPASTPIATPSTTTPGGTLTRRFASITGDGNTDASMTFAFYVPEKDASGQPIIPPGVGTPGQSIDSAVSQAFWTPLDPRDPPGTFTSNTDTHTLTDRSLAIQKVLVDIIHGSPSPAIDPGDTLVYELRFQASDFFAFDQLDLQDLLSDGLAVDPSFTPTLQVDGNGFTLPAAPFTAGNITTSGPDSQGKTTVGFLLSNELVSRGRPNGDLLGGLVNPGGGSLLPAPGDGPTTGVIRFQAVIDRHFTAVPFPGAVVGQGDKVSDNINMQGRVLDNATLVPTSNSVTDTSQAVTTLTAGTLQKSIYAINGNQSVGQNPQVTPGDTVTYRLTYSMPNANFADLILDDYLPLPIFTATQVAPPFDASPLNLANPPAAGTAKYGPDDTLHLLAGAPAPSLSTSGPANRVSFDYPSNLNLTNTAQVVDLLFSVTVTNQPFADQLLLTNQAQSTESTNNNKPISSTQIVQLTLSEPSLQITKGVIATNDPNAVFSGPRGPVPFTAPGSSNPRWDFASQPITSAGLAATPINANLNNVQASDLVSFAIVLQNVGTGPDGAFNVAFRDDFPAGYAIPSAGINLSVTDGLGNPFQTTDLGGGLFGSGLQLVDPGTTPTPLGALDNYNPTSGRNLAVITFDLQVVNSAQASQRIVNTATLSNYTSTPGGPNFVPSGLTDPAVVTMQAATPAKTLIATDRDFTSGNDLAIGEIATYQVKITVPKGVTPSAQLVDTLPDGLALVDLVSLAPSDPTVLTATAQGGDWSKILAAARSSIPSGGPTGGQSVTFAFGTLTNTVADPTTQESLTAVYRVVALNVAANVNGRSQANQAVVTYASGPPQTSSVTTRVVVPSLQLAKTSSASEGDAGGAPITYTLTVGQASASGVDAFNVALRDVIPAGLVYVPNSLAYVSGIVPTSLKAQGSTLTADYDRLDLGQTSTLQFQATLDATTHPGQIITNTADLTYTTLPGSPPGPLSPYNPLSFERTGNPADPGGAANNLNATASAQVQLRSNSLAGTVYVDMTNNGLIEPDDPRLPGVLITLTGSDNLGFPVSVQTTTDAQGNYLFSGLRPGTYQIVESQPAGYVNGRTTVGTQGGHGVSLPVSTISAIPLPIGTTTIGTGNNFGELLPSSLSGTVYWDVNRNHVLDSPDFGIATVKITLTGTDFEGYSVTRTTTTDSNGDYAFGDLRPGTYAITETQPQPFLDSVENLGSLGGVVGNDKFTQIAVGPGQNGIDYRFSEYDRPGCCIRFKAWYVGNKVAYDQAQRAQDPAAFDARYPQIGASLAANLVPRGVDGYPLAPRVYLFVPTLGRKRLVWGTDPSTGQRTLIGIPNFPTVALPTSLSVVRHGSGAIAGPHRLAPSSFRRRR